MDKQDFSEKLDKAKNIVIKIGSAVIVKDNNAIDEKLMENIVDNIAFLIKKRFKHIAVVSSGAVASGMSVMKVKTKTDNIVHKQAFAAIGQPRLVDLYGRFFAKHGINASQVLITADDIQNRRRFINAKNSLTTLLKWKSVPVINENDSVVVEELRFGDNDNLSAHIVNLIEADILIMLTNVDGVYDKDPTVEGAKVVEFISDDFEFSHLEGANKIGSGGIKSKIIAGLKVSKLGRMAVIINGKKKDALKNLFEGNEVKKTVFEPCEKAITSKQSWIESCSPNGVVVIDKGAIVGLRANKSLLASGIVKIYGVFDRGDIINIESEEGNVIAKGIANYDSSEIEKIKGIHSSKITEVLGYKYSNDVVHIDNMVVVSKQENL